MPGYHVEIEQMGMLINQLAGAAENIGRANNALRDASPSDLGSVGIDRAGRGFQDRWEHGCERISEATEGVTSGLQDSRQYYRRVEHEIARLFPGGDGTATGPQPAPDSAISNALGNGS